MGEANAKSQKENNSRCFPQYKPSLPDDAKLSELINTTELRYIETSGVARNVVLKKPDFLI